MRESLKTDSLAEHKFLWNFSKLTFFHTTIFWPDFFYEERFFVSANLLKQISILRKWRAQAAGKNKHTWKSEKCDSSWGDSEFPSHFQKIEDLG